MTLIHSLLMAKTHKETTKSELEAIPGVGVSIAKDFNHIGIFHIRDLKKRDPEKLYQDLMKYEGTHVDRCVLYVMRCAVYFATHDRHNPELLKWWNWKDKK